MILKHLYHLKQVHPPQRYSDSRYKPHEQHQNELTNVTSIELENSFQVWQQNMDLKLSCSALQILS